jgi:phospholipid/cholesterol/gamma-HCH transport system permease protein
MTVSGLQHARIDQIAGENGTVIFKSLGDWTINSLKGVVKPLDEYVRAIAKTPIEWDVSGVQKIDSAGIALLVHYYDFLHTQGCSIEITGQKPEFQELYELLRPMVSGQQEEKRSFFSRWLSPLINLGQSVTNFWHDILSFFSFVGENFIALMLTVRHPSSIRFAAIVKNIEEAGVRALPIITLTSFLIGVVIAYQGAVQLQKFGANIFIVDMIGISITRELAPLLTAIVVAGRTGSSYTAQLGTMKITEEIDAMRIMGFEPHRFLVLPRIIALMISLPLMIFFADIIGIAGGMIVSNIHLNISYPEFINRLQDVLDIKHVWIGLVKGPFFAWLIAITGCFRGLQVSRNTESIGRYTTISVVNAIFLVIACDALFSVVLTELGI